MTGYFLLRLNCESILTPVSGQVAQIFRVDDNVFVMDCVQTKDDGTSLTPMPMTDAFYYATLTIDKVAYRTETDFKLIEGRSVIRRIWLPIIYKDVTFEAKNRVVPIQNAKIEID